MWRNRFGLLLILTIAVTSLASVTHSEGGAATLTATDADSGNPFSLTQWNYEFGTTKTSSVVRIDRRTGQAWALSQKATPQGTYLGWTDVIEGGTKPKP
jgi:hypothetical protein